MATQPTCYVCGEQLSPGERYDLVLLFNSLNHIVVCSERDKAHDMMRAA
jgi:hypothetical protein